MRELSVAVIGAGHMGAFHIDTFERIGDVQLVAVADPNESAARARIGRLPIAWAEDYRNVLARHDVDAVSVCVPSNLHAKVALDAIAAGKHVLVEKPIATTLEDALRMAAAAKRAGVKLMVGHIERFNPAIAKLADLIADGHLGRVFRIHATRVGPSPARIMDTGVTMDLATHDLDIMQYVLGRAITSVYADVCSFEHPAEEDLISCLLRFGEDGPSGLLDVNWLTPEKRRDLTVIGEHGMLTASYLTQDLWYTESAGKPNKWLRLATIRGGTEGSIYRYSLPKVEPLRAELEAFARCVRDDVVEPVSAHNGSRALAAALAVLESARTSRRVYLGDEAEAEHVRAAA